MGDLKQIDIASLNPFSKDFFVVGKVLYKNDVRKLKSGGNQPERLLASFQLADSSGEIRVVLFTKDVNEKFVLFQAGKVYCISGATVKQAFAKNDHFELHFKDATTCEEVEMDLDAKEELFEVTKVANLAGMAKGTVVNVWGVLRKIGEPRVFPEKREVEIIDSTGIACVVTLWGGHVQTEMRHGDVVLLRDVKVSTALGLSLSASTASRVIVNPEKQETSDLRHWAAGADLSNGPLVGGERQAVSLAEIEKSGNVAVTVTKVFYDRNMVFTREEKMQLVVRMDLQEGKGQHFSVSVFDPDAKILLGKTPEEIKMIQEEARFEEMREIAGALVGKKFIVRVARSKGGLVASEFEERP